MNCNGFTIKLTIGLAAGIRIQRTRTAWLTGNRPSGGHTSLGDPGTRCLDCSDDVYFDSTETDEMNSNHNKHTRRTNPATGYTPPQ